MSAGIAALDISVLGPFAIGIISTVVLLARVVNHLFEKHYGIAFYCVIGFVIASSKTSIIRCGAISREDDASSKFVNARFEKR